MLGPYNTSDSPITIVIVSLIVIVVPLLSPYCYCCAPIVPILLLLCPIESHYCYFCASILLFLGRLWLYCDPLASYIYKGGFVI